LLIWTYHLHGRKSKSRKSDVNLDNRLMPEITVIDNKLMTERLE
jgi:hypothetical protein